MAGPSDIIAKKRDGAQLELEEVEEFVKGATQNSWAAEQLGAMLMAIQLNGMSEDETVQLTNSMTLSGERFVWDNSIQHLIADKHSTGGVGDKVSIPLAPALAACGLHVPMMSGRGLGHTGGTLDKLEAIPGFSTKISLKHAMSIVRNVGVAIFGQTKELAPADKRLYSIRDITATVPSLPLITASILSKKASESLSYLLLDVKYGNAAFMQKLEDARELAEWMVKVSTGLGITTRAILTRMSTPIGRMVGNSLEIIESVQCLKSEGGHDLSELVISQGGELLEMASLASTVEEGRTMIRRVLNDGSALERFEKMLTAQGVDVEVASRLVDKPESILIQAPLKTRFLAKRDGVMEVNARKLGEVLVQLGAGRILPTDEVNHAVGAEILFTHRKKFSSGDEWMILHHTKPLSLEMTERIEGLLTDIHGEEDLPLIAGTISASTQRNQ